VSVPDIEYFRRKKMGSNFDKAFRSDVSATLVERGKRYGSFDGHAQVTQKLKSVLRVELELRDKVLSDSQQEALDMIFHKVGRIVNGDANYHDSWHDIAGYAKLVEDEINAHQQEKQSADLQA
jgi:hypothetical protein